MTEFKQIIGRGSRVREDFDKMYFTIMDFRGATKIFLDPWFDGDPIQDEDFKQEITERKIEDSQKRQKYYVNGVPVQIIMEQIQYYDKEQRLISISLQDFTRQNVLKAYPSLNDFLTKWNREDRKSAVVDELLDHGIFIEELQNKIGKDLDPFDLICHVAFDKPQLTRRERVNNVKKRDYFSEYGETARKVLEALLDKYANEGISRLEEAMDNEKFLDFLKVSPFSDIGLPLQIINIFGGKQNFLKAVRELEKLIYQAA